MKKILVIGSLNIDMTVRVDHTPAAGETILADHLSRTPGGKGANQACAVGRLGGDVTLLGAVGNDSLADIQRKSLRESGVDIGSLIVKEGCSTGLAFITVNSDGDNCIVVISGANAQLSVEDIRDHMDLIRASDVVILQMEVPIPTVEYACRMARECGKTVILDPAPVPKNFPFSILPYTDIIKPNETELGMLTGKRVSSDDLSSVENAVNMLKDSGARNVIVSLGSKGCFVSMENGTSRLVEAEKVRAVDTTAAGDAFVAATAIKYSEGLPLDEAVAFANRVSAVVVTRKGAQASIPHMEEIEEKYKDM